MTTAIILGYMFAAASAIGNIILSMRLRTARERADHEAFIKSQLLFYIPFKTLEAVEADRKLHPIVLDRGVRDTILHHRFQMIQDERHSISNPIVPEAEAITSLLSRS